MPDRPLLLMVQVSCAQEHLEPLNLWYNSHLPNLLRIPGYLWAQRYVGVDDRTRFTTLYGVRSTHDLPTMLQWHGPELHPIAGREYAGWQKLQGLTGLLGNVYEQIMGTPLRDPLLLFDRPLSVVTAEPDPAHEEEWNHWYSESHVPNLLKVPGYVMAARFRAIDHPALAEFSTAPRYLALYECESEEAIASLQAGERMNAEARAEFESFERSWLRYTRNSGWGFYKPISRHFKWMEG